MKAAADNRFQSARFVDTHELVPSLIDPGRIVLPISSPVKPDHAVVFHQHVIRNEVRELPAGETNHNQSSFEGDAFGAALAELAANRIVDYIGAAAVCFALYHLDEISGLIIQGDIRAVFANKLELVV